VPASFLMVREAASESEANFDRIGAIRRVRTLDDEAEVIERRCCGRSVTPNEFHGPEITAEGRLVSIGPFHRLDDYRKGVARTVGNMHSAVECSVERRARLRIGISVHPEPDLDSVIRFAGKSVRMEDLEPIFANSIDICMREDAATCC
jgi:hypothetical protein